MEGVLEVWSKWGFQRTTVRRIAAAAQIGEASVLRLYPDKRTLIRKALMWEAQRFVEQFTRTGELESDLIGIAKLYQSCFARRAPLILNVILEGSADSELSELSLIMLSAVAATADAVAHYQASGELDGDDPWEALLALVGPLLLPFLRREGWRQLPGGPRARVESFLRGWAKKDPGGPTAPAQ